MSSILNLIKPSFYIGAMKSYGKTVINVPKPGFAFPMHMMFSLFVLGYGMEYQALAQYHVAHDKAEAAAAMECYKKHGGGGGHH